MVAAAEREDRIIGVFKGGGAKGALYAGACEAVRDRGLTFSQVAGSSAGAITAAMLACGATPRHLREFEATGRSLLAIPPGVRAALNLHNSGGVLSFEDLRKWLTECLTSLFEVELDGHPASDAGPTFAELEAAGGIPLYIACADLNWRAPVVFSASLTPDLPVALAAAASSAIPMMFETPRLSLPEAEGGIPVIDGGVMANLPLFVFADQDYRAMAGILDTAVEDRIVGFTLVDTESPRHTGDSGDIGDEYRRRFAAVDDVTTISEIMVSRYERGGHESLARRYQHRRSGNAALARVTSVLLSAIDLVLRIVEILVLVPLVWLLNWTRHPTQRGGEITATGKRARRWTQFANGVFDLAPAYLVIGLILLIPVLIFGMPTVAVALWPDWTSPFDENNVFQGSWMVLVIGLVWVVSVVGLVLVVVLVLLGVATFVVGWVAKPVIDEVGQKLVATFMRNPQEPAWTGAGADQLLIRIEVPPGWTMMRSTERADEMDAELDKVQQSVDRQLETAGLGHVSTQKT